ncbi:hypothetical protein ILYODFUR_022307 [Ilyodon furcidens]|uniref:Secreted protein n=1 Tax=Ilyodon furcidens TaxID=33524 RepID=A0ABV0U0J2_9TELE
MAAFLTASPVLTLLFLNSFMAVSACSFLNKPPSERYSRGSGGSQATSLCFGIIFSEKPYIWVPFSDRLVNPKAAQPTTGGQQM